MRARSLADLRSPLAGSVGLLLALVLLLAGLMYAAPSLPHAPAFVFLAPVALAAWTGSWVQGTVVTVLAMLAHLALAGLHPAELGLTSSTWLRTAGLGAAGALLCALGVRVRRSQVHSREALERYRVTAELHRHSEERLRSLLAREHSAVEGERRRVARELHDDLQQRLAAISIELAALRQQLPPGDDTLDLGLKRATTMTVDAIVATRRIVAGLRPKVHDELGLPDALRHLGQDFTRRTVIDCVVDIDEAFAGLGALTPAEADCLFRVAQEALNNVEKHAGASHVEVRVWPRSARLAELEVIDDGDGLAERALDKRDSFGLLGMAERVRELGGQLDVRGSPRGGTVVRATVGWGGGAAAP
jgi:signal transduction histidine kinase